MSLFYFVISSSDTWYYSVVFHAACVHDEGAVLLTILFEFYLMCNISGFEALMYLRSQVEWF